MIGSTFSQMANAEKLTPQQLQQAIKDGAIPSYIGIPLLQEKIKMAQQATALAGGQQKPMPIAQQIMQQAEAQGVGNLASGLPEQGLAGGGIVAFADGGMYEDDTEEEDFDAKRQAEIEDLMNQYAETFQGGIGQLPAAQSAPTGKDDASDFIARIMHKESRGRRYDKDGNLLTSEKGAMGEMQVMPGTVRDPGFGVKPARDNSPDELARVGRDYAQTLLTRYGDPKLAAIAYNMGPGATDKWLASGADVSKLPRETQGYVKGFADGGPIRFQNRGLVNTDYSTIEGLEPSSLYAEAIQRAQAEREQKPEKKTELTDNEKRYSGLWPYNAPEAGKFSYEDAAKFDAKKSEEAPSTTTRKPGITYAPNYGYGNVAPVKRTPIAETNEPPSEYARQMGNVAGFFGDVGKSAFSGIATLGKHLVSAPGYGFSSQDRPVEKAPAAKQGEYDFSQFDQATNRYMNDRDQARLAAARQNEMGLRSDVADAALNARIDKALAPAAAATGAKATQQGIATADPYAEFRDIFKRREENLAKQREQDKYLALLQAGLGMMGGQSPHALANIGAGATQGLQSLAQANAARTAEENALLSGRLGLAKIGTAKEQADAMMQLRRDLAQRSDERARDLAAANLEERQMRRTEGTEAKAMQRLADISKNAEVQAEKAISANAALNFAADREAKKQAMIADILRRNAAYAKTYKMVHGADADPFEGLGQSGGGGTRIRFDAQGNMIQ